jgi:hypothetical protein
LCAFTSFYYKTYYNFLKLKVCTISNANIGVEMAAVLHNLLNVITLPEIVSRSECLNDTLSAIIHTILYIRAPNTDNAVEERCVELNPLIYMKCGPVEVDESVK